MCGTPFFVYEKQKLRGRCHLKHHRSSPAPHVPLESSRYRSSADLARALGISVASIRQARLNTAAAAHRAPPDGWEKAVADLAKKRAEHYRKLVGKVRENKDAGDGKNNI